MLFVAYLISLQEPNRFLFRYTSCFISNISSTHPLVYFFVGGDLTVHLVKKGTQPKKHDTLCNLKHVHCIWARLLCCAASLQ